MELNTGQYLCTVTVFMWPNPSLCSVENSCSAYANRLEGSMNAVQGTILGLVIAMGGRACSAQVATIPSGQIERDGSETLARITVPIKQPPDSLFSSSLPSGVVPAGHLSTFAVGLVRRLP